MAMRSDKDRPPGTLRRVVTGMIAAPWLISLLWPMLLIVGGAIAWQRWGATRMAHEFVGIDAAAMTVTAPPAFVSQDVSAAVYRDSAMETLSLLDPHATAKIASAFSIHPWVDDVTSVRKLPGGAVDVRLRYRTPAAMVRVFKPTRNDDASRIPYYFPVDGSGVLLPTEDFSSSQTLDYIHIDVPGVFSTAPVGTAFGESRVEAAAVLAGLLMPYRDELGIQKITVYGDSRRTITPQLEVHLQDGRSIFWGSPPLREPEGEADAATKLRWWLSPGGVDADDLRWAGRVPHRR